MTKRAIQLIRVSTESQAGEDRASIPAQRAINLRTANAYGLTIVRSIEMSDVSGTAVLLAPEIRELLVLMTDPEIHGVIAREFSRLMRPENFTDYALLQAFADSNTVLYLPEGPIDFASKTGRLMGTIRAAIAGMERTENLERIWSAKEDKRQRGELGQSKICLPFGVDYPWRYTADSERVREAFRLFLAGETSYVNIGVAVGIKAFNLRNILRNPIYTGWRVIDQKRDLSPAGKYTTKDGRQGDRRKIKRAPEDVIRVKVLDPLVSEADFNQAQQIIALKKSHHWRTQEGYESRFTYRGFLSCSLCNDLVQTKHWRADYYICKARYYKHTCPADYMRRERIEAQLDSLFADNLTRPAYLRQIEKSLKKSRPTVDTGRLTAQIQSLENKRRRVLDSYFEGVIDPAERDSKLAEMENEKRAIASIVARQNQGGFDTHSLTNVFKAFVRFKKMDRNQKRRLLSALAPEILVGNYEIKGMYVRGEQKHTAADYVTAATIYPITNRIYLPLAA